MGLLRDPVTGTLVPQTKVTGTINFVCGTRMPYDDDNPMHRVVRRCGYAHDHALYCPEHGKPEVIASVAVSGPAHLLWPDPEERRQAEEDIARDKGYI